MEIKLKGLDITCYKEVLDNGLEVILVPMENKKNYYINYATKFGSDILEFKIDGENTYKYVPQGIAHFLEHKMFEQENGVDPFNFFSESGTDCNAATSNDSTMYYCIGNKNFNENLEYLLKFVNSPYYTEENVNKEKGIIAEELKMYDDIPEYYMEKRLKENIYKTSNRRIDIGGTIDSIQDITKEDLYLCYNNFYTPNNMFLLVVGNFNKEEAINIINNSIKNIKYKKLPIIKELNECDLVNKNYEEITMSSVSIPKVEIGLKINYSKFNYSKLEIDLYLRMLTTIKFGGSSLFREVMREENIANDICSEWETSLNYMVYYISGNCNKSDEFINKYKEELVNKDISIDDFLRIKKVWIANEVRSYDEVEGCLDNIYDDIINYGDIIDNKIDVIRGLKYEDMINIYSNINLDNISIVKMTGKN